MAIAKKNRKAMAYTFIAISIISIALFTFAIQSKPKLRESVLVSKTRIDTMNDFMKDVQKDLSRGMFIASYRALLAIVQLETDRGSFVQDSRASFYEAFMNGTINKTEMSIVQNASFNNWTQRIKLQAEKIGIGVDFNVLALAVEHISPWDIQVNATVLINLSDSRGAAHWKILRNLSTTLSIKGLEDPAYIIKTNGKVSNIVNPTDVDFSTLQNLQRHINNSFYIASATGPSYLMRLQGNLSSSDNGIESIVNLNELSQQGIITQAISTVDYIYFGNVSHSHCLINETQGTSYDWFRLDNGAEPLNHLDDYGLHCKG